MQIGELRQRVTIYEKRTVNDPAGQPVDGWQKTHRKLPAARLARGGSKVRRGEQVEANVAATFVGRYCDFQVITPGVRLECDGVTYDVAAVDDQDGTRTWLEVSCSALA